MKRMLLLLVLFTFAFSLAACTEECPECEECQECEQCEECETCETCETCEECVDMYFYAEEDYPGSGYTPGYTYYLSGTLNGNGEITSIRYDMVSVYGTSKRSTDYLMNLAKITVGGVSGSQTVDIFIGGSSTNVAQIYNVISAPATADGSELFKTNFPILGAYPGAVVEHADEIYNVLASGLGITIDDTTTLADVLTAAGLYDTENGLVKNGHVRKETVGVHGGGSYDNQLTALEEYIVQEAMTLRELTTFVQNTNTATGSRDTVAGATIMFDDKIIDITAKAANVLILPEGTEITYTTTSGTDTVYTITATGMELITAEVTVDNTGLITDITVTSHTETANLGGVVISDGTLVANIIAGQADLTAVDTIAGSTITSNALIAIAEAALAAYNE